MGFLEWSLVGVAAWFLIGYVNARLVNDSPLGHMLACGNGVCHHYDMSFEWSRPVETDSGRTCFGVAFVSGPLGAVVTLIFILVGLLLIELVYERIAVPIGRLLAPK